MKKSKKAIIIIFVILTVFFIIIAQLAGNITKMFDFNNTETVTVTFYDNKKEKSIEITNKDDIKQIEKICSGKSISETFETPACFFDTVNIILRSSNKSTKICPSGDDCRNILICGDADYYHSISKNEMNKLIEILEKNGINWIWDK